MIGRLQHSADSFPDHQNNIPYSLIHYKRQGCLSAYLNLKNLKDYLASPPLLSKPKDGETYLVYLAISKMAVSVMLV